MREANGDKNRARECGAYVLVLCVSLSAALRAYRTCKPNEHTQISAHARAVVLGLPDHNRLLCRYTRSDFLASPYVP